jgi:hypothetical protein
MVTHGQVKRVTNALGKVTTFVPARFPWPPPAPREPRPPGSPIRLFQAAVVHEAMKGFHVLREAFDWCLAKSHDFDLVFAAQRDGTERLRDEGIAARWLPLACDPEVHRRHEVEKATDLWRLVVAVTATAPHRDQLL